MGVFSIGGREVRCGVFRRLCVVMIVGWDFYWFGVGQGYDVFLWGGRVRKGRSLLWLRCRRCVCTMLGCVCTMLGCICVEFAKICCCVTVSGCVSVLVV